MAGQKLTTSIDPDLLYKLKVQAAKENRRISAILNELIEKYLQEKKAL